MTPRERTLAIIASASIPLGVSVDEVIGPRRTHRIAVARHASCAALRRDGKTLPAIARSLGRCDHSTVAYGIKRDASACRQRDKIRQMAIMAAVTIAMVGEAAC